MVIAFSEVLQHVHNGISYQWANGLCAFMKLYNVKQNRSRCTLSALRGTAFRSDAVEVPWASARKSAISLC